MIAQTIARDSEKHERMLVFFSSSLITFKKVTTPQINVEFLMINVEFKINNKGLQCMV